jgi:glycosyltransferase involved in cell wall biosynthesis
MVTGAVARGGSERQMIALTNGLLGLGQAVEVCELVGVVAGQSSFADECHTMGVTVRRPGEGVAAADGLHDSAPAGADLQPYSRLLPANIANSCRALMLAIRQFRPSVVHCWSDLSNLIGGFVSSRMRVPRIVLGQRVLPPPLWFDKATADLYGQAYRALAGAPGIVLVNNSASSGREYEQWLQLPSGTVKVVRNGFLQSSVKVRARSEAAACREHFGLPSHTLVVGAVMRFAPEKDPILWLETAAAVAAVRPDVHFLLAGYGHGAVAEQLCRKGTELGLGRRLVMPGVVTDVGQVYGALDVCLLTSRLENLPNVLIEAQAAGIPVVGPDVGGVGEAMLNGVTGLLVRNRCADALARAVLCILDDRNWSQRAAEEAPLFVDRQFRQERLLREMLEIYHREDPASGLLRQVWRAVLSVGRA